MRRWAVCALLLLMTTTAVADEPWRARRRPGLRPNRMANARVTVADWPAEPTSPARIDPARFASALHELCGWMRPGRPLQLADWILRFSAEFDEDPFLLGALAHRQTLGSCRSSEEGPHGGVGLTMIRPDMYSPTFSRGVYRYRVRENGGWVERERRFDRYRFAGGRLRRGEDNLYFAAALLSAWRDQHGSIDEAFTQVPHRHYVSHFVWGDRVRSQRNEDDIFIDRRRLLEYYGATDGMGTIERLGVTFGSSLDGAPRVVSSGLGSDRDGGNRSHRGIDLESIMGEPVRAVADGRVVFAGVDLPGRQNNVHVDLDGYDEYPRRDLGRGGRFVCIRHARVDQPSLRTCYMHLETVEVEARTEVRRGDRIGTVGRTGMERSAAHLHLELHGPRGPMDASEVMSPLIIRDPNPRL